MMDWGAQNHQLSNKNGINYIHIKNLNIYNMVFNQNIINQSMNLPNLGPQNNDIMGIEANLFLYIYLETNLKEWKFRN